MSFNYLFLFIFYLVEKVFLKIITFLFGIPLNLFYICINNLKQ